MITATTTSPAESPLNLEQSLWDRVFRNVPIGVYRMTPEGRLLCANPALIEMLGHDSFDDIARQNLKTEGLDRLETEGKTLNLESFRVRRDGVKVSVRESITAVRDNAGKVLYYEGTVENLPDRSLHQESYIHLLQAAVENANDAVLIMEAEPETVDASRPRTLYVNPAFERMTGYTRRETLGKTPHVLRESDTLDETREKIRADIAAGKSVRTEILSFRKDGTPFWGDLNINPVADASGKVTRLIGILRDVTERRRAEKSLQTSEQRLQTILNNLPVVVFVLDQDGVFTFLQGKGLPKLGLEPAQVLGKSFFEVHSDEPDIVKNLQTVFAGSNCSWLYTKQGVTFEMQCRPFVDSEGKPAGLIGAAVDVTERHQLREKILQSEKLATLGEIVAGVAHEMNNPLAAISGNAQLLALHPDSQVQEDAHTIRLMADRASHIVRSLITFAGKNGDNGTGAEWDIYSLQALSVEAISLFRSRRGNTEDPLEIAVEESPETPEAAVRADRSQLLQVIVSLLSNAEQALRVRPVECRKIVVRIGAEETAWLSVSDTGSGMSELVRQRIFEPFFTTKEFGEGAGLGLSLCHGIVEAHRGNLCVETQEGVGTTITLHLPLHKVEKTHERNEPL